MYSETAPVPLCPVGNRSLKCLASLVILDNGLPYEKHLSSLQVLKPFIQLHKKRGNPRAKSKRFLKELKSSPSIRILHPPEMAHQKSDEEAYDD